MDMKFSDKLVVVFCTNCDAFETNLSPNVSMDFSKPGGIAFSDSVKKIQLVSE